MRFFLAANPEIAFNSLKSLTSEPASLAATLSEASSGGSGVAAEENVAFTATITPTNTCSNESLSECESSSNLATSTSSSATQYPAEIINIQVDNQFTQELQVEQSEFLITSTSSIQQEHRLQQQQIQLPLSEQVGNQRDLRFNDDDDNVDDVMSENFVISTPDRLLSIDKILPDQRINASQTNHEDFRDFNERYESSWSTTIFAHSAPTPTPSAPKISFWKSGVEAVKMIPAKIRFFVSLLTYVKVRALVGWIKRTVVERGMHKMPFWKALVKNLVR